MIVTPAPGELDWAAPDPLRLQALGASAGEIAHDFNNLLTVIRCAAEDGLQHTQSDPATVLVLEQIRASAERGASLVAQLLKFGRPDASAPRVFALNEAVQELAGLVARLLGRAVRLELALDPSDPHVRLDPAQLDQVVLNLAANAYQAMPDGGTLVLRTGHATLTGPLSLGQATIPAGRYVTIEASDTGGGIAAEVLPRIFDRFVTTRRAQGGSGLGLATAWDLVRQAQGLIAVESEIGRGTCMRIYLPHHLPHHDGGPDVPPEPVPAPMQAGAPSLLTVLLVEDEEPVRRLACRALQRRGWTVLAAASGEEALEIWRGGGQAARVLVADVELPGLGGVGLACELRRAQPDLAIVLTSGYGERAADPALGLAGVRFLAKPYGLSDLVDSVTAAMTARSVL